MKKDYRQPIIVTVIFALLMGPIFSCCLLSPLQSEISQKSTKDCCRNHPNKEHPANPNSCECKMNTLVSLEPENGILKSAKAFSLSPHRGVSFETVATHFPQPLNHFRILDLAFDSSHMTIPLYLQFHVLRI